jgi:sec-independent protein translocase protein TatA
MVPGRGWYAACMPNIGTGEIVLLLLIALLLFGAKRLPEIGRSLGSGMREFKDSVTGHSKPEATQVSELPPAPNQDHAASAARENETVH